MDEKQEPQLTLFLPFLGSFIVFLGMIRLTFYYSSFGIKIVSFLEFSEIVTSFFDILITVVIIGLFSVVQHFLIKSKKEQDEKSSTRKMIVEESSFWRRLPKYFSYFDTYLYSGIAMLLVYWVWSFFNKAITNQTLLLIPVIFLGGMTFIILIIEIDVKHRQLSSNESVRQFYGILMLCLFLLILLIAMTKNEVNGVKEDKTFLGTTIKFDNDTVFVSDSSNYFIGKTQNYLFIYHEKDKSTDVYPMSQIKQIVFKQKSNR